MENVSSHTKGPFAQEVALELDRMLDKLRGFTGETNDFWCIYAKYLAKVASSPKAVVVAKASHAESTWVMVGAYPHDQGEAATFPFTDFQSLRFDGPLLVEKFDFGTIVFLHLDLGHSSEKVIAAIQVPPQKVDQVAAVTPYLVLNNSLASQYRFRKIAEDSIEKVELLAGAVDFSILVNKEEKFVLAAMLFCNELAARYACDNVSLGWIENGYVRVKAVSRRDHFDKKSEAVAAIEKVMEETFDQDMEVVWPAAQEAACVSRDHQAYANDTACNNVCSIPLRLDEEPIAVVTLERTRKPFSVKEVNAFRLLCDQSVRRLADLKTWDRWIGQVIAERFKEKAAGLLGFEHTWAKLFALAGVFILAVLCFVKVTHRVEATAILRSENVRFLTSPFDGHIDSVSVRLGDSVKSGEPLLQLDQSDLRLEEAGLLAEQARYQREFEKARASNALADMRIAQSRQAQATAQLNIVRHKLAQSIVGAPFDGVVVEGDLKGNIGAPVRQGDVLFRLAKTDMLYVEIEIKEDDMHFYSGMTGGELALASRPNETFGLRLLKVEPVAIAKEGGNVFVMRGVLDSSVDWWRPGMTGIAKLNAEKRTLLWIFTHKTVEFLRLYFWW